MHHEAIRHVYPNVVTIDDEAGAFDADGNQIDLDETLVNEALPVVIREANFKTLRQQRNELLAETDYFGMPDVTMSDEMKAYRQALRDLPANTADPTNPVWPTKP